MAKPYKLRSEIEQFIVEKKREDSKFSCRKLVLLIKEKFGLDLSKSSINAIIKENSLSAKIGRPRVRQKKPALIVKEPVAEPELPVPKPEFPEVPVFEARNFPLPAPEIAIAKAEPAPARPASPLIEFAPSGERIVNIENGGALFLLMADYKFGLTLFLAQKISVYLTDLPKENIRILIQARIYRQMLKEDSSVWKFLGKELTSGRLDFYYEQLEKLPFEKLSADFASLGLPSNISDSNELYKQSLLYLNKQVKELFLPSVYQFLDFPAMRERFYNLAARIERKDSMFVAGFLYPAGFQAIYDIVWQDDFKSAVSSINKERVFAPEGLLFRFEETLLAYQ
jgi:hypothetical protein